MSTLFTKIREERLEKLYNKYPQHREWFEEVLVSILSDQNEYRVVAYTENFFRKEWAKALPVYDDNGPVELEELLYLEGLSATIYSGGEAGYVELVIKVKGE